MNIQEYISSGILEQYVLDDLSHQERAEVEQMMESHLEVREEVTQIENTLLAFAEAGAKEAPSHLQFKIATKLNFNEEEKAPSAQKVIELNNSIETESVKATAQQSQSSSSSVYRWLAAASIALLVASGVTNVWLYEKYNYERNTVLALREQNTQMADQQNILKASFDEANGMLAKLENPYLRIIPLPGLEKTPECHVTVYWNAKNGETMAMANSLPAPPDGHQYQLWAIVDGKPVDMGMFNTSSEGNELESMKVMDKPQAFAVTLEVEGGVPEPTLENMMVLGNVNV